MLWVSHAWGLESVFFGHQDFGPSVCEQILVRLELLLLLLQASRSGYKPALEALLLDPPVSQIRRHRGSPRLRREAYSYRPPSIRLSPIRLG